MSESDYQKMSSEEVLQLWAVYMKITAPRKWPASRVDWYVDRIRSSDDKANETLLGVAFKFSRDSDDLSPELLAIADARGYFDTRWYSGKTALKARP